TCCPSGVRYIDRPPSCQGIWRHVSRRRTDEHLLHGQTCLGHVAYAAHSGSSSCPFKSSAQRRTKKARSTTRDPKPYRVSEECGEIRSRAGGLVPRLQRPPPGVDALCAADLRPGRDPGRGLAVAPTLAARPA